MHQRIGSRVRGELIGGGQASSLSQTDTAPRHLDAPNAGPCQTNRNSTTAEPAPYAGP